VGTLVADCEKQGRKLSDLTLAQFKKYSPVIGKDVYKFLGAVNVVSKYVTEGAAGQVQAEEQIAFWKKRLVVRPGSPQAVR
jgi:argininosuccinate lyase